MFPVSYVLGVDFGTDSVRTILVDTSNGAEIAASVFDYPRWKQQRYCDAQANRFRQHPLDYVEGLEHTIKACVQLAGPEIAAKIKGISVDTTGSTPVATDKTGTPLALLPGFEENPHALFVLWKDHTAVGEAAEINTHATRFDTDYLQFVGGIYSSEWFWAKLLRILREDEQIRNHLYSFVEHCDWIPFLLTGGTDVHQMKRSVCAAGHKLLWSDTWGGLPPNDFFASLDPLLNGIVDRLFTETYTSDKPAGKLSPEWATRLGLTEEVIVGVGAYDAHMGAVGGQIEPYYLSKVIGTSTCDMMVVPVEDMNDKRVRGICGQVNGSVIPGMIGLEAGQSAFGDAYAWFKRLISWPLEELLSASDSIDNSMKEKLLKEIEAKIIPALSEAAAKLEVTEDSELAVDWFNGRRTPDASQLLTASVTGIGLGSDAVRFFRAVAEATCFGARAIVERFREEGISVNGLIGLGGVARKSPFVMQLMADVMNMPIRIHASEQTCALGAAMFAATAAGIYPDVQTAMRKMGPGFEKTYHPYPERVVVYQKRYTRYRQIGAFMEQHILNQHG